MTTTKTAVAMTARTRRRLTSFDVTVWAQENGLPLANPSPMRLAAILRMGLGGGLAAALVAGCGGQASSSTSSSVTAASTVARSSTVSSPGASTGATAGLLAAPVRRRVALICRHAETTEDHNLVVPVANRGASILSPNVTVALSRASQDLTREAATLQRAVGRGSPDEILVDQIQAEATIAVRVSRLQDLRRVDVAMLSAALIRIDEADAAGVPTCAGAARGELRPPVG